MVKRVILFLVKICVTVGLFVLLFYPQKFGLDPNQFGGVKPSDMLRELREAETHNIVFWLTFAVLIKLCGLLCGIIRWRLLLYGQGLKIPFWYMVRSWFIGRTIGIFLPGTIGLDGWRLIDSSRYTGEVIKCTTVIAVEKLIGFVALTFLVFLTFPLGYTLLNIKTPVLIVTLAGLAGFVTIAFVTLLNPRILQVLVAVFPTPPSIRTKFDKLGAAITAYSGNRKILMLAVVFGLGVHLATCFMYFGTMMAIRASNTGLADILFASPLMIYGTVLGPSIGGEGIREIVFVTLLSGKSSAAATATFAHLGWWVGELVPFVIGAILFPFHRKPTKEQVQERLAEARAASQGIEGVHLSPEATADYRNKLVDYVIGGVCAGLIGGALVGLAEGCWLVSRQAGLSEVVAYWWGPLVYGIVFVAVGLGIAGGLAFLSLLVDRFLSRALVFGVSLGGTLATGLLIIGRFRYSQDILGEHALSINENLVLLAVAGLLVIVGTAVGTFAMAVAGKKRGRAVGMGIVGYICIVVVGVVMSNVNAPAAKATSFQAKEGVTGPNIILIAVDTLRADYLKDYNEAAAANTPNIDALRADSVMYRHTFAQSSWTKPSFATIFSGMYPEAHGAIQKDSILPDEVTTFPEVLHDGGYYTEGFANNPNIAETYNYGQGFVEYQYLRPDYLFGANQSAEKMVLYKVLRQVYEKIDGRIRKGRLNVHDFYQPAEVVTEHGLNWLDSENRPKDAPFLLFLHYMDPHDPYMDYEHPGVGYARVRLGTNLDPTEYRKLFERVYNGEIEHLDRYIGELIHGLKDRGLYEDSVIVFTADHGEEFSEHGGWFHGMTLYDEQIEIPLIIKLPQNQLADQTNVNMTRHVDIAPTLLQFAGLQPAPNMQGKTLFLPDNKSAANTDGRITYCHLDFEGTVAHAVRTMDSKLITANEGNKRGLAPVELYDMVADPGEMDNLAGRNPALETEMSGLMDQMHESALENAVEPQVVKDSSALEEELGALGYLGGDNE